MILTTTHLSSCLQKLNAKLGSFGRPRPPPPPPAFETKIVKACLLYDEASHPERLLVAHGSGQDDGLPAIGAKGTWQSPTLP